MSELAPLPDIQALLQRLRDTKEWRLVAEQCRAILKRHPTDARALRLLSEALLVGGRAQELIDLIEPLVRKGLKDTTLLFRYAAARSMVGDSRGAAHFYRRVTELQPDYVEAWLNLGVALRTAGRVKDAAAAYRQAISLKPDLPEAHNNLGLALQQQGEQEEALAALKRAIELRPGYARAYANMSQSLLKLDRIPEAEEACRKAIELEPEMTDGYLNLGLVLMAQNRQHETAEIFRRVALLQPDDLKSRSNLGVAEKEVGNIARALELQREANALDLDDPTPLWNEAHALMLMGDFALGWERYEARWGTGDFKTSIRPWPVPVWRGEPIGNRALLLHVEQGVGDTAQFCRYVPLVCAANPGAQVILETQKSMLELLQHSFRETKRLSLFHHTEIAGPNLPPFDLHLPLASLPRALGTRQDSVPGAPGYLQAPSPRRYRRDGDRLVIGISWKSVGSTGRKRSLTLERMAGMLAKPGVRLVDLQYGDTREERQQLLESRGIALHHDEDVDAKASLAEFANQVAGCDLVISIDNTTVHIAGALGVPCWVLLPWLPDWRWMLQREDTPWYDSLKLYRPPELNAWEPMLERLEEDFGALLAGDQSRLAPIRWEGPPALEP